MALSPMTPAVESEIVCSSCHESVEVQQSLQLFVRRDLTTCYMMFPRSNSLASLIEPWTSELVKRMLQSGTRKPVGW